MWQVVLSNIPVQSRIVHGPTTPLVWESGEYWTCLLPILYFDLSPVGIGMGLCGHTCICHYVPALCSHFFCHYFSLSISNFDTCYCNTFKCLTSLAVSMYSSHSLKRSGFSKQEHSGRYMYDHKPIPIPSGLKSKYKMGNKYFQYSPDSHTRGVVGPLGQILL